MKEQSYYHEKEIPSNIEIIIKLYCFEKNLKEKINRSLRENEKDEEIFFYIKKNIMKSFKTIFYYEYSYNFFEKNKNIFGCIKKGNLFNLKKLDNSNLSYIIKQINKDKKDLLDKIENADLKKFQEEIILENNKKWEFKELYYCIEKKNKMLRYKIKYLEDFEIINFDIFILLLKKEPLIIENSMNGNCLFDKKYFFFILCHQSDIILQIGKYNKENDYKIKYLFNSNEIENSKILTDYIKKKGIKESIKDFNEEINYIEINGEKILCYNNKKNKFKDELTNFRDSPKNYFKKFLPKSFLNHNYSKILKSIIFISIYQNLIHNKYNENEEKVLLINIDYLKQYKYTEINNIIANNNEIQRIIGNININDLSFDFCDEIIDFIKGKELKKYDEEIKNNKNKISTKVNGKKIKLNNNKKIKIYKDFVLINLELFKRYLSENLDIIVEEKEEEISFISINNKDILKVNTNSQFSIFIGNLNYEKFNLEKILEFKDMNSLNSEFKYLIEVGIIDIYFNERLIINDIDINKAYISPIIVNDIIIGDSYNYKSSINDYSYHDNNYKYLENDNLIKIFSLTLFILYLKEKIILEKNTYEEYYLINHKLLNDIRIECEYKYLKDELENIKSTINILENNYMKNIFSSIKLLSPSLLNKYLNKKIEKKIFDNTNNELEINSMNYFDHCQNNNNSIIFYHNFEIVDKKIIELFIQNYENNIPLVECYFNNGYIIINLPNNLNRNYNNFISIIGRFSYDTNILIEYFLVYKDKNIRKFHIQSIQNNFNLNNYLSNLNFSNNTCSIIMNERIIGTIVKYDNKDHSNIKKHRDLNENYKNIPLIGLQNIGATCYMNATLQCFCHIKKFVEFFKYNSQIININENTLSFSFKLLISKLWPDNYIQNKNDYYAPHEFKEKISNMNPLFKGVAANDSKDLVNFIILKLHIELNKIKNIQDNNNYSQLDQSNKDLVFQNFTQDFMQKNKSIISDLFYAINCNVTQCSRCQIKLFNYQTYFFITFPLEEVRKFKTQFNQFNNYNNEVHIYDCFNYDRKINVMNGENSIYCNYCKMSCEGYMSTNLITGPEILIIILNRGKGKQFDIKIKFEEILNLKNYIEYTNTGINYLLTGVITHIGESGMGGHFIAYCRDIFTNLWYKFNDAIVSQANFQTEVLNFAMPYLLFYQKIDNI